MRKTLSATLLAAFLANPLNAAFQPEGPKFTISSNHIYTAQLHRDSQDKFKKTWFIYDGNELIGDEKHEEELFQDLAFTATIAGYTSNPEEKQLTLNNLQQSEKNFYRLIKLHSSYDLTNTALRWSSQALGMVIPPLVTGSIGKPNATQIKEAERIAKSIAGKFISDAIENLYVPNKNTEDKELAKQLRESATRTAVMQLELASRRLNTARKILFNHEGYWNPRDAAEFYSNYKTALTEGLAYATILDMLDREDLEFFRSTIGYNIMDGLGIPNTLLKKIPRLKEVIEGTKLPEISMQLNREIDNNTKRFFSSIESYFNLIQPPTLHDLQEARIRESDKERRSNINSRHWLPANRIIERGQEACYTIIIENNSDESYKSLEIIIDKITGPDGIASSQQRIGLSAQAAQNIKNNPYIYHGGSISEIENAVCLEATIDAKPGKYTLEYFVKYQSEKAGYKFPQKSQTFEVR